MDKDIFDIENLNDVPKEIQEKISIGCQGRYNKLMMELFAIKDTLTIDELIVGLYRKFKIAKTRDWVSATCYNMKKTKLIERIGKGVYRRIIR